MRILTVLCIIGMLCSCASMGNSGLMRTITITHPDGSVEVIEELNTEAVAMYSEQFLILVDTIERLRQDEDTSTADLAREEARMERIRLILEALRDSGFTLPKEAEEQLPERVPS